MIPKRRLEIYENEHSGKFRCPHCGMLKDFDEKNMRARIDNVRLGLGPWFMPNWYKITAEKKKRLPVPCFYRDILSSCP